MQRMVEDSLAQFDLQQNCMRVVVRFDKKKLRESENPFVKKTAMKIRDFIRDAKLRDFFASA